MTKYGPTNIVLNGLVGSLPYFSNDEIPQQNILPNGLVGLPYIVNRFGSIFVHYKYSPTEWIGSTVIFL